jgi:hypothetical protein
VRPLPFYWGNAGWTLTPYEVGNLVGPATDAHTELQRILAHHPALTCSPIQSGWFFDVGWADRGMAGDFVVPSWLTFVGTDLLTRAPEGWADDLDVTELPHGVAIRLPEPLPGDTRPVVQALAPLMPRRDVGWEGFEKARLPDV